MFASSDVAVVGIAAAGVSGIKTGTCGGVGAENSVVATENVTISQSCNTAETGRGRCGIGTVIDVAKVGTVGIDT